MAKPLDIKPHFDISAAVVKQLGEELVTDEVTAIMELIKNSYDADSNWVNIEVDTKGTLDITGRHYKNDKGYILVEDGGFGMNTEDILERWMVISMSGKRHMKERGEKTVGRRTPLGDKGLGRLSTQRLGERLEMLTTTDKERYVNRVAFNWKEFTEDIALADVPILLDQIDKPKGFKGTKLIITHIKDPTNWDGRSADRFKGQLSQLIFPFKDKRAFNVFLKINGEKIDLDELSEAVRDQAHSRFKFSFDNKRLKITGGVKSIKFSGSNTSEKENYSQLIAKDNGSKFFKFLTNNKSNKSFYLSNVEYDGKKGVLFRVNIDIDVKGLAGMAFEESHNSNQNQIISPGPFDGEIDEFNLKEVQTSDSAFSSLAQFRDVVKNQAGVRIFRDGFGIKPFGLDGEDWLGLNQKQSSSGSFYMLRPSNVIGYVAISAERNQQLKEKTDREGFVDSPHSQNFFLMMDRIVDEINYVVERSRRSYNEYKSQAAGDAGQIKSISDSYKRLQETSSTAKKLQADSKRIETSLSAVSNSIKGFVKEVESAKDPSVRKSSQLK